MRTAVRERLVDAAFDLFEERGFDRTTVDDVVDRAGAGRTTFFRHFRAKEDAVLADHDLMLARVTAILEPGDENGPDDLHALAQRVVAAARTVLEHYVVEGERARRRYRLSATVPAIRSREAAGMRSYQHAFLAAIHDGLGGGDEASLEAELAASAVITATHHTLRRWLRGETEHPEEDFDSAITRGLAPWLPVSPTEVTLPPHVLATVRRTAPLLEELLVDLRSLSHDSTKQGVEAVSQK